MLEYVGMGMGRSGYMDVCDCAVKYQFVPQSFCLYDFVPDFTRVLFVDNAVNYLLLKREFILLHYGKRLNLIS